MKVQDSVDSGLMDPATIPPKYLTTTPVLPDIDISLNGILKLLSNLKPGKAAGPDKLRPLLLKELLAEIAPIIKVIFQKSLETGQIPAEWCRANVTPIFKKGDKSLAVNYHPIPLTCILCKVLEHILASNIVNYLEQQGAFMISSMVSGRAAHVRPSLPCLLRTLEGRQVWVSKPT